MLICHAPAFVFVHVPKTGGSSITAALRDGLTQTYSGRAVGQETHQHFTYERTRAMFPAVTDAHFSFLFVRNPWDRMVAMMACYYGDLLTPDSFGHYLALDMPHHRWKPLEQVKFLQGRHPVSFVGRYEALAADFARVTDRLAIRASLPHVNRSVHRPYRDYYDDRTRRIVAQRSAADIEAFGYRF